MLKNKNYYCSQQQQIYFLSNTFYQTQFIKYHLSNTIYQIPFIKYHLSNTFLSNTLYQIPFIKYLLGATSIGKIPKISASGRNFLDPLPPLFEKGPYRRKRRYFVPNSNYKVRFFQSFKPLPPLFHQKAEPHRFCTIEVAPKSVSLLSYFSVRNHSKMLSYLLDFGSCSCIIYMQNCHIGAQNCH